MKSDWKSKHVTNRVLSQKKINHASTVQSKKTPRGVFFLEFVNDGNSDGGYNFFLCSLTLEKEPISAAQKAETGGTFRMVAKEVRTPCSVSPG